MENKSLITLVQESNSLELMLIESDGQLTPEIEAALSVQNLSMEEKVDGYAFMLEKMKAMEEFYAARAEYMSKIAERCSAAQKRLKDNLKFAMDQLHTDTLQGSDVRFKLVPTSGKLVITDEEMIPVEYKKEVTTTEIDKKALKEAAKNKKIPGAQYIPDFSIRTYSTLPNFKKGIAK